MNKVISWMKNLLLRQVITVFVMGITLFALPNLNYSGVLQAQVMTPEDYSDMVYSNNQANVSNNNPLENLKEGLKETADNVREKLNLDEPIPESTKEFLNSVQEKVEETVEPITGTEHGYYQENIPAQ
jgi:ABC-type dipeptide/oligopeptide/nickel transport system permease component